MKQSYSFFLLLLLFFQGCSDSAMVNVFDEKIAKEEISCLKLVVFDKDVKETLQELYSFDESCDVLLEVSLKSSITCNSNQNVDKKILSNFPSSYLRMQLYKGKTLFFSYYIDLKESVSKKDVKNAFLRVQKELNFKEKQ
ncbi:MAG: hypothetical protein PHS42_04355 [Sulfurimonas sp.]|nr:hypothetical protein [Sulfurimonas sp.]MDD3834687.1 hypothetical protein [Sulfurimonas sp.]